MYVQNQDMYVQNQDMYVQNQYIFPFFQVNWNELRYIGNEQHQVRKICLVLIRKLLNLSLYICGLSNLLQGKDIAMYVQNQDMYVQNQGMYVQNQAFFS